MAAGSRELRLAQPQPGGGTRRDHLLSAARQGAPADELLAGPAMPAACAALWGFFLDLHAARGSSGSGPLPLRAADIEAAARLARLELTTWEVDTLMDLDRMALRVIAPPPPLPRRPNAGAAPPP